MRLITMHLLAFILFTAPALAAEGAENAVAELDAVAANTFVSERDSAHILDVRTPEEYAISHIPGALNINVQDASFESLVAKLDKNQTYVVHCTKNPRAGRSSRALATLQSLGFRRLYSLEGGYLAWKDADLPLSNSED